MTFRNFRSVAVLPCLLFLATLTHAQGPGTWAYTGSLNSGRVSQTATTLENGLVLIAGGKDVNGAALASAELYNPSTGAFAVTGSLSVARYFHTATLLNNGKVLIVGGDDTTGSPTATAELYNPGSGTFTLTGGLVTARQEHTATLLPDGTVLVAGGADASGNVLQSAEIYNLANGAFSATGNLVTGRSGQAATLLDNGTVLISGGADAAGALQAAEIYSPGTRTFASTGSMNAARSGGSATLLNDGEVLICGGTTLYDQPELYNPQTGTFALTGTADATPYNHSATLLTNGSVLLAGGWSRVRRTRPPGWYTVVAAAADLYDPIANTLNATGSMNEARDYHTANLLSNGKVLVVGGGTTSLAHAELYEPTSSTPSGLQSITLGQAWVPVGSAYAFLATGNFSGGSHQTLAAVTWSSSNTAVATISSDATNSGHAFGVAGGTTTISACAGSICGSTTLTVTASHENLILGSSCSDSSSSTFEEYDDSGNRIGYGNLPLPLSSHSAVLLGNGTVFVAGGNAGPNNCSNSSNQWEIFSPSGQQLSTGYLQDPRNSSAATLLGSGDVFLAGGTGSAATWEIRSPNGSLVSSGSLNGQRLGGAAAVTLQNGNIWISGSAQGNPDACTWEIHNSSGALVSSGSLFNCDAGGQVQLLQNGNVMIIGGDSTPGTFEIYSQTGTLVSQGSLITPFNSGAGSVLLTSDDVFVFGSCQVSCGAGSPASWEILTPSGGMVSTGSLLDSRASAGAVLLSNGNIFITGGNIAPGAWEIRSSSGALVSQGSLLDTRYGGHSDTHF